MHYPYLVLLSVLSFALAAPQYPSGEQIAINLTSTVSIDPSYVLHLNFQSE